MVIITFVKQSRNRSYVVLTEHGLEIQTKAKVKIVHDFFAVYLLKDKKPLPLVKRMTSN